MNYPDWTRGERSRELSYMLKFAALRHNRDGSVTKMAKEAGFTKQAITHAIRRGDLTTGMASAFELLLGREVVKKEQLCSKLA